MKPTPATSGPVSALMSVLTLGVTSCIVPRLPGQSQASFTASRARVACVDEAKRLGFDNVTVVSDREGGDEVTAFSTTILIIRLRVARDDAADRADETEVTCSYDMGTGRASIFR